jgi:hypothetical protein
VARRRCVALDVALGPVALSAAGAFPEGLIPLGFTRTRVYPDATTLASLGGLAPCAEGACATVPTAPVSSQAMTYRAPLPPPPLVVTVGSHVVALDYATGRRLWEHDLGWPYPRLHVAADRVLVLHACLDCIHLASGQPLWRAQVSGGTLLCDGVTAFVGGAGEVHAVALADGRVLWHEPFKGYGTGEVALALPGVASQIDRSG